MNELTTAMSKQFKRLIALKAGIVQCIYTGWAANGFEKERPWHSLEPLPRNNFIQTSTQIVTQVINEKSDRIEAFTDRYMEVLIGLIEAQKKESLVDLLSAFAGSIRYRSRPENASILEI